MWKFRVFKSDANGEWYWNLIASNGRIVAQSEGYHNRADCLDTIASIQTHAKSATIVIEEDMF